ncbi:MAG TPA: hypothetical protein VKQ72_23145 [Aggregatilineales bacterium]|nr:hypothetical protein [Aggregatilineales bacterium]
MSNQPELDAFWADLLSEETWRIQKAWGALNDEEKPYVMEHLNSMATDSGWAESQRDSAKAALIVIEGERPA